MWEISTVIKSNVIFNLKEFEVIIFTAYLAVIKVKFKHEDLQSVNVQEFGVRQISPKPD